MARLISRDGFRVSDNVPIDARIVVENLSDLGIYSVYRGLVVYQESDDTVYSYTLEPDTLNFDADGWVAVGIAGAGANSNPTTDTLPVRGSDGNFIDSVIKQVDLPGGTGEAVQIGEANVDGLSQLNVKGPIYTNTVGEPNRGNVLGAAPGGNQAETLLTYTTDVDGIITHGTRLTSTLDVNLTPATGDVTTINGRDIHSGDINFRDFDTFQGQFLNQHEVIRLPEFNRAFVRTAAGVVTIGTIGQTEAFVLNIFLTNPDDYQEVALGENIPGATTFISSQADADAIALTAVNGQFITIEGGSYTLSFFSQLQYGPTAGQTILGGDFIDTDVYLVGHDAMGASIGVDPVFTITDDGYNIQLNHPATGDDTGGRFDLLANDEGINFNDAGFQIAVRQNPMDAWIAAGVTRDSSGAGHEGRVNIVGSDLATAAFGTEADPNILAGACLGILQDVTLADGFSYVWNQTVGRFEAVTPQTRTVTVLPGGSGVLTSTPSYDDNVLVQDGDFIFFQFDETLIFTIDTVPAGLYRYRLVAPTIQGWINVSRPDQYNNNVIFLPGEIKNNEVDGVQTPFRAIAYTNNWATVGDPAVGNVFQENDIVSFLGIDGTADVTYWRWDFEGPSLATDIPGGVNDWMVTTRPFADGIEPGVDPDWENYWDRLSPYVGELLEEVEDGIRVAQTGGREQIDLFNEPATGNPVTPTSWRLTLNEGETDATNIATLPELIASSKWGTAPTGTKPSSLSWNQVISPVSHDSVSGEIVRNQQLGADFRHDAVTDSPTLRILFLEDSERQTSIDSLFLVGSRAVGPVADIAGARVIESFVEIDTTEADPENPGQNRIVFILELTFEENITVPASDADNGNIELYSVDRVTIHTIEGGSYARGVLTIATVDDNDLRRDLILSGGFTLLNDVADDETGFTSTLDKYNGEIAGFAARDYYFGDATLGIDPDLIDHVDAWFLVEDGNLVLINKFN